MNFKNLAAKIFRLQSAPLDWFVWRVIEQKLSNGYKFSPAQKKWLSTLLAFPERQYRKALGFRDDGGNESFCCLGQAAMLVVDKSDYYWTPERQMLALRDGGDSRSIFLLSSDIRDVYELNSCDGEFKTSFANINSLAQMNDDPNYTWTDLAWYVIENPHNVFEVKPDEY
jgi:hypothetical protein